MLTLTIFIPTIAAFFLIFFNKKAEEEMRYFALGATAATFLVSLLLLKDFDPKDPGVQPVKTVTTVDEDGEESATEVRGIVKEWIPSWNIQYKLGYDGISLPLVLLTGFVCVLAMLASWSITKQDKVYLILYLL
jgi:NADH-quinone oxidoreductase subunit M